MKAKNYILYFFLFKSIAAYSQKSSWTISGSVIGVEKMPIESAIVFVNNTTIGVRTNEKGNFQLNIPNKFSHIELNVLAPSSKTLKRKIGYSPEIQVFRFQMDSISITNRKTKKVAEGADWREKWNVFESALLGNSKFAKDCRIVNPEVVRLEYNDDKKIVATADKPVIIRNSGLGYTIVYQIDKLVSDSNASKLSGLKFFEKINPGSLSVKTKWDKNRKSIHTDSFRNFLVTLSLNKLEENDFTIYKITANESRVSGQAKLADEIKKGILLPVDATQICTYDKDSESYIIESEYPLLIFTKKRLAAKPYFADYPYTYTEIMLPKGYAVFTYDGLLSRPNEIVLKGYWGTQGLANKLPDDYEPESPPNETINISKIDKIK